ncbi:pre-mrna-splicing factor cwc21 [Ophiostoma piceae UAMH 11346]|uniref:Pre-mrna-splicing factor cwc21 n=1 Tax=Ophiostoma piceae (strain UAMH 11346) TaxID=1262450 RepID=S3CI72_OPHP1|nr:pre-mrna-splicing factor cwc21 [Ophiostoma piceae UAMH 11346]
MSDNVGLSTPRGSGTSGYVQRNRAFIRPRDNAYAMPSNPREALAAQQKQHLNGRPREPDQGILEHDRKRAIEVRVFALRDELEDKAELDEDAIDEKCDALRKALTEEAQRNSGNTNNNGGGGRQRFKAHQVHEQARAKQIESERLRRALRINKDYEEGGHWRRQEEKQTLKRKQDEQGVGAKAEPERKGRESDKRRRRYSNESDGYSSYEEGEIGRSGGRRSPEPLKSVERPSGHEVRRHDKNADARAPGQQRHANSPSPIPPRARRYMLCGPNVIY